MSTHVVIAEDHAITRQGLRTVVEERLHGQVAGETGNGLEVLSLVETHAPDVLLLDLTLPGLNGLDVLRQLHSQYPETKAVVLSMHSEDSYVVRAFHSGASAYVLKGAATEELVQAIQAVQQGDTFLSSSLPTTLLDTSEKAYDAASDRYAMLTDREREVLQLIAEGYTSSEIGERLFISRRTVDKHRENLMAKLELHNHANLVRYALQRGLIPLDPPDDTLSKQ